MMKNIDPIFFSVSKKKLLSSGLGESPFVDCVFPLRIFPKNFKKTKGDSFCLGYFQSLDGKTSADDVFAACERRDWQFLNNLAADFLIVYFDNSRWEFFALTDMSGKFPLFFSVIGDNYFFSSNFAFLKSKISSISLDWDGVFDLLDWSMYLGPSTILKEIKQLPPATVFQVSASDPAYYSLTPLCDLNAFLSTENPAFNSIKDFTAEFLDILTTSTREKLESAKDFVFCSELSSGFDVSLVASILKRFSPKPFVCYSTLSEYMRTDTNYEVMLAFGEKHGLSLKIFRHDHIFPFSTQGDLTRTKDDPMALGGEDVFDFQRKLSDEGVELKFSGDGADEVYQSFDLDILGRYPIQEIYFNSVRKLKFGANKVLTEKGTNLLLGNKRFESKEVYPQIISPSLIRFNKLAFESHWETGTWPLQPFADQRLIQFARRIPRNGNKTMDKQDIWRHRSDIFLPSQFREKGGAEEQANLFLYRKRDLIIDLLENSILGNLGLVRSKEILADAKSGNMDKYKIWGAHVFLVSLLRLEYFLRHNKVHISDDFSAFEDKNS